MTVYGNFNQNRKRKGKKIRIAVGVIAVLLVVAVFYIGLIAGDDSTSSEHISTAVQENVQLKQQISELNDQITLLNEENAKLKAELGIRPTVAPVENVIMPSESPEVTQTPVSPRDGLR